MPLPPTPDDVAALDPRRKRVLFRAWHRGIREMDLVMGRFAERELPRLDDGELNDFEALLEEPDDAVYSWLIGRVEPPARFETPLFERLRAFDHARHEPGDV